MKKKRHYLLLICVLSFSVTSSIGQTKAEIQKVLEEKQALVEFKESEIKKLKEENNRTKKSLDEEIEKRNATLREVNEVWLWEPFKEKYSEKYFLETDFTKLNKDSKSRMDNSQLMSRSILLSEKKTSDKYRLAERVDRFNENYYIIDQIVKEVLEQKYDEEKVEKAIKKLTDAPEIENSYPLNKYKNDLLELLLGYKEANCSLSESLNGYFSAFSEKGSNPFGNDLLGKIEVNQAYPFLLTTVTKFVEDYNWYSDNKNKLPDSCENANVEEGEESSGDIVDPSGENGTNKE